jgi:anti-sigma B factor antagonist
VVGTTPRHMADRPATDGGSIFRIDVEHGEDGRPIVVVSGDVDLHSAPELRERLTGIIDGDGRDITVDLTEATFLDSMALGVLLAARTRLEAVGGQLELVVSNPDLIRIFEITMLDRVFVIRPAREPAAASDERESA